MPVEKTYLEKIWDAKDAIHTTIFKIRQIAPHFQKTEMPQMESELNYWADTLSSALTEITEGVVELENNRAALEVKPKKVNKKKPEKEMEDRLKVEIKAELRAISNLLSKSIQKLENKGE